MLWMVASPVFPRSMVALPQIYDRQYQLAATTTLPYTCLEAEEA